MAIRTRFTKKEHSDSGLALLLLTLVYGLWSNQSGVLATAIAEVMILLTAPVILYPFTFLWLNLSGFMGSILSRLILSAIFIVVVCPVAFVRKASGKDSLQLKKFKKGNASVFTERNHAFGKNDFITQY